jgi:uncharacterized protein (TIGR03000 family)
VVTAAPAYVQPAAPMEKLPDPKKSVEATVTVQLPEGAKLRVDGQIVPMEGTTRTFTTPTLEPGQNYYYTMEAVVTRDGKEEAQSQRVVVRAGGTARVDFRTASVKKTGRATVTVRLPDDARLTVDGETVALTAERTFQTPPLETGRRYFYTLKAEVVRDGQTQSDSQRVFVEAGKSVEVSFSKLEAVRAASR